MTASDHPAGPAATGEKDPNTDSFFAAPPSITDQLKLADGKLVKETHLVAFQHGLWGAPQNLFYLVNSLLNRHRGRVVVLPIKANADHLTYDGILVCGTRTADEIVEETDAIESLGVKVSTFSIVGYSLGGLISRCAIGLLYARGYFENKGMASFTSIATPHLGAAPASSSTWKAIQDTVATHLLGPTGDEMTLQDGKEGAKSMIESLADEDGIYYKALAGFKKRKLYANVINDRLVPFFTAFIADEDPFENPSTVQIELSPENPRLVASIHPTTADGPSLASSTASSVATGLFFVAFSPILLGLFAVSGWRAASARSRVAEFAKEPRQMMETSGAKKAQIADEKMDDLTPLSRASSNAALEAMEDALGGPVENPDRLDLWDSRQPSSPREHPVSSDSLGTTGGKVELGPRRQAHDSLNKLVWEKYKVKMESRRSHAAIVVREKRWEFDGGPIVKHFADNFVA